MGTKIKRVMVLGSVLIAVSGVVAILLFLPAPYAVWLRIKSPAETCPRSQAGIVRHQLQFRAELRTRSARPVMSQHAEMKT
jgi:hypothetical protein